MKQTDMFLTPFERDHINILFNYCIFVDTGYHFKCAFAQNICIFFLCGNVLILIVRNVINVHELILHHFE